MNGSSVKRGFIIIILLLLFVTNVFAQSADSSASGTLPASTTSSSSVVGSATPQTSTASSSTSSTPSNPLLTEGSGQDLTKSYDWLLTTSLSTTASIQDQALTLLALLTRGGREKDIVPLIEKLLESQDKTANCWPDGQCTVKDTAFAYLVLQKAGKKDTSAIKTWLQSSLIGGLRTGGEWRIQIEATEKDGTCSLSWGQNKKKEVKLKKGELDGTSNKYYLNIVTDLHDSTLFSLPNSHIMVDCSALGSDTVGTGIVISLLYAKTPTELYILQSTQGSTADLSLSNGCFGEGQHSSKCVYESTLYASWALVEAGEKLQDYGTQSYLETALDADDLHKAVLVRTLLTDGTLSSNSFVNSLVQSQRPGDGSWKSGDILTTAWAAFALSKSEFQENVQNARLFLQRKQSEDGSWDGSLRKTALALLAVKGELSSTIISTTGVVPVKGTDVTGAGASAENTEKSCNDLKDNDGDGLIDCGDLDCSSSDDCRCDNGVADTGEIGIDCGGTCTKSCETDDQSSAANEEGKGAGKSECASTDECGSGEECKKGKCITPLESSSICKTDKDCGDTESCTDGTCVSSGSSSSSSLTWIFIVVGVLVVLLGGAFFYLKFVKTGKITLFKKKNNGLSFEEFRRSAETSRPAPQQRPQFQRPTARPGKHSSEDEELDKSLKEAEKLLKEP